MATTILLAIAAAFQLLRGEPPSVPQDVEAPGHVLFADTAGWYQQTTHEVALASPFDLSVDGMPASLPLRLGTWRGTERPADPEVDRWFRDPVVAVQRTYRRDDDSVVWLSAFGHRGSRSYHLFEHTPDTCYPLGGWRIDSVAPRPIQLEGPRPFTVNHGVARRDDGRQLVFMYLYLWDQPGRDPERGVLSLRVAAPVRHDADATLAMLEHEFLPHLFQRTLSWRRF